VTTRILTESFPTNSNLFDGRLNWQQQQQQLTHSKWIYKDKNKQKQWNKGAILWEQGQTEKEERGKIQMGIQY